MMLIASRTVAASRLRRLRSPCSRANGSCRLRCPRARTRGRVSSAPLRPRRSTARDVRHRRAIVHVPPPGPSSSSIDRRLTALRGNHARPVASIIHSTVGRTRAVRRACGSGRSTGPYGCEHVGAQVAVHVEQVEIGELSTSRCVPNCAHRHRRTLLERAAVSLQRTCRTRAIDCSVYRLELARAGRRRASRPGRAARRRRGACSPRARRHRAPGSPASADGAFHSSASSVRSTSSIDVALGAQSRRGASCDIR